MRWTRQLCFSAFPQISLCFIFYNGRWLSDLFPYKDRALMLLRSGIVYKFTYQYCGALYLGQTLRRLHTRISEYIGVSPLTGRNWQRLHFPASRVYTCMLHVYAEFGNYLVIWKNSHTFWGMKTLHFKKFWNLFEDAEMPIVPA